MADVDMKTKVATRGEGGFVRRNELTDGTTDSPVGQACRIGLQSDFVRHQLSSDGDARVKKPVNSLPVCEERVTTVPSKLHPDP